MLAPKKEQQGVRWALPAPKGLPWMPEFPDWLAHRLWVLESLRALSSMLRESCLQVSSLMLRESCLLEWQAAPP